MSAMESRKGAAWENRKLGDAEWRNYQADVETVWNLLQEKDLDSGSESGQGHIDGHRN